MSAYFFSAPGRTEISGNHTDHQHGCVLAAVNMETVAEVILLDDPTIIIHSEGYPSVEIKLDDLEVHPEEMNTAKALVRGVAAALPVRCRHSYLPICWMLSRKVWKRFSVRTAATCCLSEGTAASGYIPKIGYSKDTQAVRLLGCLLRLAVSGLRYSPLCKVSMRFDRTLKQIDKMSKKSQTSHIELCNIFQYTNGAGKT